jgi:hypothetical protein
MKCYYTPFHYSIISGWNKKNVGLAMPYYKHFEEFTIHRGYDARESETNGDFRKKRKEDK